MTDLSDEVFAAMIEEAIDALPEEYVANLSNVAVVYADEPTPEQRRKLRLRCDQSLFGLYEGIPRTQRGAGYNFVLPDKITIFKLPILGVSRDEQEVKRQVARTLWHEIAHHYGLGHDQIHALESKHIH
jgi:predicted Zn-dependent protease with MMP-like domain